VLQRQLLSASTRPAEHVTATQKKTGGDLFEPVNVPGQSTPPRRYGTAGSGSWAQTCFVHSCDTLPVCSRGHHVQFDKHGRSSRTVLQGPAPVSGSEIAQRIGPRTHCRRCRPGIVCDARGPPGVCPPSHVADRLGLPSRGRASKRGAVIPGPFWPCVDHLAGLAFTSPSSQGPYLGDCSCVAMWVTRGRVRSPKRRLWAGARAHPGPSRRPLTHDRSRRPTRRPILPSGARSRNRPAASTRVRPRRCATYVPGGTLHRKANEAQSRAASGEFPAGRPTRTADIGVVPLFRQGASSATPSPCRKSLGVLEQPVQTGLTLGHPFDMSAGCARSIPVTSRRSRSRRTRFSVPGSSPFVTVARPGSDRCKASEDHSASSRPGTRRIRE